MKIIDQPNSAFKFEKFIPKGTIPNDPPNPRTLKVDVIIPHWGVLRSIEMGTERNGVRVYDINTYSIGIKSDKEGLHLQFQFLDHEVDSVQNHSYKVDGTCSFCTLGGEKNS